MHNFAPESESILISLMIMKKDKHEIIRTLLIIGLTESNAVSCSKMERLIETAKMMNLSHVDITSYVKSTLNLITAIEILIDKM